jgi:hypothetical protein
MLETPGYVFLLLEYGANRDILLTLLGYGGNPKLPSAVATIRGKQIFSPLPGKREVRMSGAVAR